MYLAEMTSPQVGALSRMTPVVLPVAAVEQHGPHMPLGTDALLCEEVARRAFATDARALLAPVLWLGSSHHHLDFPGTLSASPRAYLDTLVDLVEAVLSSGFSRVLILNGHGGNTVPCQQILFELRQRHRDRRDLLLLAAPYWALGAEPRQLDPRIRQTSMGHACEWETSMMLRLAPHLVGDYRSAPPVALGDDPFAPAARAWNTRERSAAGHVGDPRDADAEKGEILLHAFTDDAVRMVERMRDWDGESWSG